MSKSIFIKFSLFLLVFTGVFYVTRFLNLLPLSGDKSLDSIPWLFSAISLIFSIISGFIIQSRWLAWDDLFDATHGELRALKQLHILVYHLPVNVQDKIRGGICEYLNLVVDELKADSSEKSEEIEETVYQLEYTVLNINPKNHPHLGRLAFDLIRKCVDYREKRLQNSMHRLPGGVKAFIISATTAMILSSLFIDVNTLVYDYLFTLTIGMLSYGIFILIDDLDNPYRPGHWHLTKDLYEALGNEVKRHLKNPVR